MKTEKNTATVNTTVNPFDLLAAGTTGSTGRKLSHTAQLIQVAQTRATEVIQIASSKEELHELANRMMQSGDPQDLIALFEETGILANLDSDIEFLRDAGKNELKQMLESRRSDRSKLKKKGIASSIVTCRGYIAAFYAETMIREVMDKPYAGRRGAVETVVNVTDVDAVNRKIKSLQSKLCRLRQMNQTDEVQDTIYAVETEIERLKAFRPVKAKAATKSIKVDDLREALSKLDPSELPEEVLALMAKLG